MIQKNIFKSLKNLLKKYIFFVVIGLIAATGVYFYFNKKVVKSEYIFAERKNLVQEVSVTGKVKPASKVDLAFESTGKVAGVFAGVGDYVYSGQKLAFLNNSQYQAQYAQAQASLEAEQSKLDELKKGTRVEELSVQNVKIQNAEISLIDAKNNLVDKIKDSYSKSDDAVRNNVDQLFDNPRNSNPQLVVDTIFSLETLVESSRVDIENIFNIWYLSINNDNNILQDLSSYSDIAKNNLNKTASFLSDVSLVVNGLTYNSNLSQTIIDGYKTDIASARSSINTAISSLFVAEEKVRTAEATLLLEQQNLLLKQAGATNEQIKEQESRVKSADANVDNYGSIISKTIIYSPISGVVTKVDIKKGEIAQLNTTAITVMSSAEFEIEANIPEADIAKINVGDYANVTLDAYEESDIFKAKIISIEPAETVVEGVSTYKTIFQFQEKDKRIRSGMTANIDITTGTRENVVSIPVRLLRLNGDTYVKVLVGENIEDRVVETGMRSSDGLVEIISGLNVGDKVLTSK